MSKRMFVLLILVGSLTLPVSASPTYSGSMGLTGSGVGGNATVFWSVEFDEARGLWDYSYCLVSEYRDISHVILETSQNVPLYLVDATPAFEPGDPQWYYPGGSNPDMPEQLFGVKWDVPDDTTEFSWSFSSDRSPMWGDVYAKDGSISGVEWVAWWNEGFTVNDLDPSVQLYGLHDGPQCCHLLVPDTYVVPAPGAFFLGSLGLGFVGWFRMRRVFWDSQVP